MRGLNRKDDAQREARNLIAQLRGEGWKPQVWENIGWHYKAISGPVQVYPFDGKFWCMVGDRPKDCAGGAGFWTPQRTKTFKDPNRAVRDAMQYVYDFFDRITETVAAAEKAMGKQRATNTKET